MNFGGLGRYHFELFILLSITLAASGISYYFSFLSAAVLLLFLLITLCFVAFSVAFVFLRNEIKDTPKLRPHGSPRLLLLDALFVLSILTFVMIFFVAHELQPGIALSFLDFILGFPLYFLVFLPLFFLSLAGTYLFMYKKAKLPALVLFSVVFAILLLIFVSGMAIKSFSADDELLITASSINSMLHGINPYSASYANVLYENRNLGLSLTTQNRIMSTLEYPPLFLLSFMPFYFLSTPTLYNLEHVDFTDEAAVFLLMLLIAFSFSFEKKDILKPSFFLFAFFVFAVSFIASIQTFLMIAILMLAYSKLESKYIWLALGVILAFQEELWPMALFLLLYSLNNQGIRKGLYNISLSIAVFLIISAYFMFPNPLQYFSSILAPSTGFILPNGSMPFGFFLVSIFHVTLSALFPLFLISLAILSLLLLYFNKKEFIPLFALIPFLFLSHGLPSYLATFSFLFLFAVYSKPGVSSTGEIGKLLRKNKQAFYAALLLLIAVSAALLYDSHSAYDRNFNISITNETLSFDASANTLSLNAQLDYNSLENNTVFIYAIAYENGNTGSFGLLNQSIILNSQKCSADNYTCLVNVNKIVLGGSSGAYALNATLVASNASSQYVSVAPAIYNGEYYYLGKALSLVHRG